jgi:ribosomal-protein-alanine N-acetyltransferase
MILNGEKVILRSPRPTDAKQVLEIIKQPEISKNLGGRVDTLKSIKDVKKWLMRGKKDKSGLNFVIIDKKTNKIIGRCGLKLDNQNKIASAVWLITKEYWGKNYSVDALHLLINFGFKKLKLNRIEADVYKFNLRSLNFAKKLGFKVEGVARKRWFKRGKFLDVYTIGLLKREWKG